MRLLSEQKIQEYFTSGSPFPDMGDNAIATPYIIGIIAYGIYAFLSGYEHSSHYETSG